MPAKATGHIAGFCVHPLRLAKAERGIHIMAAVFKTYAARGCRRSLETIPRLVGILDTGSIISDNKAVTFIHGFPQLIEVRGSVFRCLMRTR